MLTSQLFAGDPILEAVADDQARISRTQNRKGEHVRKIQEVLLLRNPGVLPQFGADGTYGDETAEAVVEFKINELGVPPAEVIDDVGPRTVIRLDEIQAAAEQPVPPPPPPPPPPAFVRRDIWTLQTDANWHPIVLAYARAVRTMQSRPITDPTSWAFQAAIHGSFSPSPAGARWNDCQHGHWFFLPWHRMYLFAFENIVRQIVTSQGGPADFAIPYWNYDQPAPRDTMPVPFRLATLPDGSPNPLRVAPRGRHPDWDIGRRVEPNQASPANALAHLTFSGPPARGFGGGRSAPTQLDGASGSLELTPHNVIHPEIGGARVDPCAGGLMTDQRCAALDPIFWLHHANIDRIWNRWNDLGGGRANPGDAAWLGQSFQFHDPGGSAISLTCSQVVDTISQLGYMYDDQTAPVSPPLSPIPTPPQPPQLGGASVAPLQLVGSVANIPISVPADIVGQLNNLFAGVPSIELVVEDIEGTVDAGLVYEVFLDVLPAGGGEPSHNFVGNVSFFGLGMQGDDSGVHNEPPGLRHIFDITPIVEELFSADLWNAAGLSVSFEPLGSGLPDGVQSLVEPVPVEPITIGRISLFFG